MNQSADWPATSNAGLRITFVTPKIVRIPTGIYRVVYEYANQLASLGHTVTIVHPLMLRDYLPFSSSRLFLSKAVEKALVSLVRILRLPRLRWFHLVPDVNVIRLLSLDTDRLPPADIVIASNWNIAIPLYEITMKADTPIIQFVHHYPVLSGYPESMVDQALTLPVPKVVVSRWTQNVLVDKGYEKVFYIPNGVDHSLFRVARPVDTRPNVVCMNYVEKKSKDPRLGIEALTKVKRQIPDLEVILFGPAKTPPQLPFPFQYFSRVRDRVLAQEIYNASAVFLSSSRIEGFSLPAAEAMACGCAVVATDSKGLRDFAIHNVTALLAEAGDVDTLSRNLVKVLTNRELRIRLAMSGVQRIRTFSWERSARQLESLLLSTLKAHKCKKP